MKTYEQRIKDPEFLASVEKLSHYWPDYVIKAYSEKNNSGLDSMILSALNSWRSMIANSETNFTLSNLKYEVCFNGRSYHGYDDAFDPVGYTWYDLIPPEQMKLVDQYAQECARTKKPIRYIVQISTQDQTGSVYLSTVIWPIIEKNEVIGFMTQSTDITEQKNAETRLIQTSQMAAMGEILGAIVHEINNPMAVIHAAATMSHTKLEKNKTQDPALLKNISRIIQSAERVTKTIHTIKNLFRPHGSNGNVFSIQDSFQEIQTICTERFKIASVNLTFDIPLDACLSPGDINSFTHCLLNLTNNAFDAIHNTEASWVKISLESNKNGSIVRITDSGQMPEEVKTKIFKTSFTTKPRDKGTGLGLGLCQRIIHDMGGKIYLDPASETTSFVIELPKAESEQSNAA